MLIIIEGCDGTGKSTLAAKLAAALPEASTEIRHCGPLERHPLQEYELDLETYAPGVDQHVVYDRHFLGELVYGPLYRSRSQVTPPVRLHLEMFLQSRGAVLVLLTNDPTTLRRRNTDETFLQDDDLEFVLREFSRQFGLSSLTPRVIWQDPSELDVDQLLSLGERAEEEVLPLVEFPSYVGPPDPELLLLGERRGPGGGDDEIIKHQTTFAPYASTSGHYLLSTLLGLRLPSVGLANAFEVDVPKLHVALGRPAIVTLGSLAHRHVEQLGLAHGAVPHPQYVRRFHHGKMREYGEAIVEAWKSATNLTRWPAR